jgi:hypothetical protein
MMTAPADTSSTMMSAPADSSTKMKDTTKK